MTFHNFLNPEQNEEVNELLSVIELDWEEEIADVLRLNKVLKVLKVEHQLEQSLLESYERKKNLDAIRRDFQRDDIFRIKRKLKVIRREKDAEKLFDALRQLKESELNTDLESKEAAYEELMAEIKNCDR